jgi:hypothetical protein
VVGATATSTTGRHVPTVVPTAASTTGRHLHAPTAARPTPGGAVVHLKPAGQSRPSSAAAAGAVHAGSKRPAVQAAVARSDLGGGTAIAPEEDDSTRPAKRAKIIPPDVDADQQARTDALRAVTAAAALGASSGSKPGE